ncbi:MAG: alpha-amylase family glycosyl hydrolase [Planctomycetota bacterium]
MTRRPSLIVFSLLASLVWVWGAEAQHTFRLNTAGWHEQPRSVHVAGSFNGWSMGDIQMTPNDEGVYVAEVDLEPGVVHYKFILNGSDWINDTVHSDRSLEESDGHGGVNSAVLVGPDARRLPAPEPNHIRAEAVEHDPSDFSHRSVVSEDLLLLGIETQAEDVETVVAHVTDADGESSHTLKREGSQLGRDSYVGLIQTTPGEVSYRFELIDGDAAAQLAVSGFHGPDAGESGEPFTVEMSPTFRTPDWAKHAVWYQIFPERFRNGDPRNDPGEFEYENLLPWTVDWWKTHTRYGEAPGRNNFYEGAGNVWNRRFGGDLQGVQEALPYLRRLGVNAIYFNPIFEADSMHKYDTADFRHVDDNFGVKAQRRFEQVPGETDDPATWGWSESDKVFLAFLQEAKRQGFRVVIDGVFNHVGTSHPFFQDVMQNGRASKYADWFEIAEWGNDEYRSPSNPHGIGYVAWDGYNGALPVFKNDRSTGLADGPRQHIFDITRRWLDPDGDGDPSDGIDGWRLDVPGDIAHPFWIEWRQLVKSINPDAYITGEIWPWAHPWLQGDQFDAVMNYQFAMPAVDFFVDQETAISPSQFAQRLNRVAYSYPMQVSLAQMNLFDSHDTDRVASMFVNPDRNYDGQNRLQDSGPNYDKRKPNRVERARMKQAVVCKMTFVGAPMIYYGTEAGMWSPDDPSDRMPMSWPGMAFDDPQVEFDEKIFEFYQRVIALRNSSVTLQLGAFFPTLTDDRAGVLAYERLLGDDRVTVVLNRSPRPRTVDLPLADGAYHDLLAEDTTDVVYKDDAPDSRPELRLKADAPVVRAEDGTAKIKLPAYGSVVLVSAE